MVYRQLVLVVLVAGSFGFNYIQYRQIDSLRTIRELSDQKESLLTNGYNELILARINELKQNQLEIAKNQGKIEGMVAVIQNLKPEDNLTSELWHHGYYRGLEQSNDIGQARYKEGYHAATADAAAAAAFAVKPEGNNSEPVQ